MKKKLHTIVMEGLTKYPVTRNSDKMLTWYVWGVVGVVENGSITKEDFLDANTPSSDSITRCRRKIVETHPELDASSEVKIARDRLELEKGGSVLREEVVVPKSTTKPIRKFRLENGKAIEYYD